MKPKTEMRIYECLGVKLFRKMVFLLEKLVHRRDKGLNINYHIPSKELGAMDAFIKYLFYNGAIHVRKLIFFGLYLLVKIIFQWKFRVYDVVLILLAVKDLYCVMLQRYNLLRIRQCKALLQQRKQRKKEKNMEKTKEDFEKNYDFSFVSEDLALVKRLKSCIENRESVVLSDADVAALNRLLRANDNAEIKA